MQYFGHVFSDTHQSEMGLARYMYLYDRVALCLIIHLKWFYSSIGPLIWGCFFTVFKQRKRPVSALSWIVRLSHFMGASLSAAPS